MKEIARYTRSIKMLSASNKLSSSIKSKVLNPGKRNIICAGCQKVFEVTGKRERKFCCLKCFQKSDSMKKFNFRF